jgi:hypothetical protein
MRSKVRISLSANNSLELARQRSQIITRSVWRERFIRIRDLPDRGRYMKWPCLGGITRHKKSPSYHRLFLFFIKAMC